jgi:plastocyanin
MNARKFALITATIALAVTAAGCTGTPPPTTQDRNFSTNEFDFNFSLKTMEVNQNDNVTITITNNGTMTHDFNIDAYNIHITLNMGETKVANFKATTKGTFEYYCAVPFHKAAGMVGTLTVN